jgi:hypothetical protein
MHIQASTLCVYTYGIRTRVRVVRRCCAQAASVVRVWLCMYTALLHSTTHTESTTLQLQA